MNKAYRLIWSKAKEAWVIVAEIVKGNGGPPPVTVKAAVVAAAIVLLAANVDALPVGQQVVNGTATFATTGNTLTVTNSPNAIINWQGFSVAAGERTTFNQQNAASAVLNRVTGAYRSDIFGMLDSNGKVFLINPNGIIFGSGSQVNVAGLVASSLGISNQDFLAGKFNFSAGSTAGAVQNQGAITTTAGGMVWLISPNVENSGLITTPSGSVMLAAGQSVNMVDPLRPEIAVVVSAPADQAVNIGTVLVQGGSAGIFGGLINQQGIINADSAVTGSGGRIFLKSTVNTTLGASSVTSANALDTGDGGRIVVLSDGETKVAGTLSATGGANGGNGGFIETSGKSVKIAGGTKISTLAPAGKTGMWLIDPTDFTIGAAGDITGADLSTALSTTDTVIEAATQGSVGTNGDIFVNEEVTWSSANKLTLLAARDIGINAPITATDPNAVLTLDAPRNITQTAPITAANLELLSGNFTLLNPDNAIGTLAGNVTALTLFNKRTLTVGTVNSTVGLTASGNVSLTADATGQYGQDGIVVNAPISAANVTLTGTGGAGTSSTCYDSNCSGQSGGYGVRVDAAITATSGNVSIKGTGGEGGYAHAENYSGYSYSANGGDGGRGISVSATGSISANGTVYMKGTGGKGGYAKIVLPYSGYGYGGDAYGGKGGIGISVGYGATITSLGDSTKEIRLIGEGGFGGDARGGDYSYPWGSGGSGGNARGGDGGSGISHSGIIEAVNGASVFLTGTGRAGGYGTGGYGGYNEVGPGGNGGSGLGGNGGHGIEVTNGTITTSSGSITLKGYGGGSGDGFGGTGGEGGPSGTGGDGGRLCPDGCYYANAGHGIYLYSAYITSGSGLIDLHGEGGAGGKGISGDGFQQAAVYGGSGYGGDGGAGVYISGGGLTTGGTINIFGTGGGGGLASGGSSSSSYAYGGDAGVGVDVKSSVSINSGGTLSIEGNGGLGGAASGYYSYVGNNGLGIDLSVYGANFQGTALNLVSTGGGLSFSYSGSAMNVPNITTNNGEVTISGSSDVTFVGAVNAGTGSVTVTSGGAINGQTGISSINAGSATLYAQNGIGTTAPFLTAVSTLTANNNNPGVVTGSPGTPGSITPMDINISNTGTVTVMGMTNNAGSITLNNVGGVTVAGNVEAASGTYEGLITNSNVSLAAHSPLTVNPGILVNASGGVTLVAGVGAIGSTIDNLLVGGNVTAQNGNIILRAGNSVTVTGTLLAPNGMVTIQQNMNPLPPPPPPLTSQMASLLPGVNEIVVVMGKESTDLSEEDEEGEEESTGEGGQDGTEFKSLPYCN